MEKGKKKNPNNSLEKFPMVLIMSGELNWLDTFSNQFFWVFISAYFEIPLLNKVFLTICVKLDQTSRTIRSKSFHFPAITDHLKQTKNLKWFLLIFFSKKRKKGNPLFYTKWLQY